MKTLRLASSVTKFPLVIASCSVVELYFISGFNLLLMILSEGLPLQAITFSGTINLSSIIKL